MAKIELRVEDKPPKKIRGKSMWTAESQIHLVQKLRIAAFNEMEKLHLQPFRGDVSLTIDVHLPSQNNDPMRPELFWGDLDNIVSGVCESLQKANRQYSLIDNDPVDGDSLVYLDDSQIIAIKATKTIILESKPSYFVKIEDTKE